jgi:hypothetical protein
MDAKRARFLAGSIVAGGLLASLSAGPAMAADCTLSAPATINVGTAFAIEGAGFPASSSVDVTLAVEGGASDAFTVQSNAAGTFRIDLTPETADIGKTTVVATAGSACSVGVAYTILGANQTAPPTAEPAASAAAGGTAAPAPRTDTVMVSKTSSLTPGAWLLAVLVLAMGGAGLLATRMARRR